jgi:predicted dinucleotide-binding enzyme
MSASHIAVIGAGHVGSTLGRRFAEAGHRVTYGLRDPESPKYAALTGPSTSRATVQDAVAAASVVLLATPWNATHDAILSAGDLTGKVLIDATNPIGPGMVLTHGTTDSGAEQVARWAPGAQVVKAFNTIGVEVMANPVFGGRHAALFYCGDDDAACAAVASLATDIGFEPVRLGMLVRARVLEPSALVWITATGALGTREFALGLLRRA